MKRFLIALVLGVFSISANAMLWDRGGGLIYDDVLDATWLQDANYGAGSSFDDGGSTTDGKMSWNNAVGWANNLSYFDSVRNVTWDDWRLASMDVNADGTVVSCDVTTELACRDHEYAYLFNQYGISDVSPGLFTNVQSDHYWSGTGFASRPDDAWAFVFSVGQELLGDKSSHFFYAWAVRDGDVGVVPVPAAVWLFGSALGLLGWIRRKKAS
jgi:hypothetical protein